MNRLLLLAAAILLAGTLLSACGRQEKSAQTSSTQTSFKPPQPTWDTTHIYRGLWHKTEDYDFPDYQNCIPENIGYDYPDSFTEKDLKRSMRTAIYTPTGSVPDSCEFVMVEFRRNGYHYDSYQIWYMYDYSAEKVLCYYNGDWYNVQNYDLLVSDLACLSENYTYDKYLRPYGINWDYGDPIFYYTKFFGRETGFDPSYYSGFVNVTPVEDMTEEKAIELARAEAARLGYPIYKCCYYDPFTDYWCVDYTDGSEYSEYSILIYLDPTGCTVQITPKNNWIMS